MYDDLVKHLEGQVAYHRANCRVYMRNSAGIGEHAGIVEAIETEIEKIANAEEKIETIQKHFSR